jgi:hypothetical protein
MWEKLWNSKYITQLCMSVAVLCLTVSIFIGISAYQDAQAQCVPLPPVPGSIVGGAAIGYECQGVWNSGRALMTSYCAPWGGMVCSSYGAQTYTTNSPPAVNPATGLPAGASCPPGSYMQMIGSDNADVGGWVSSTQAVFWCGGGAQGVQTHMMLYFVCIEGSSTSCYLYPLGTASSGNSCPNF